MRRPRQAAGTNIRRSSDRIVGLIGCDLESAAEYRGSTPPKRGITCAFSALRPEVIEIIFRFSSVSPGRGRHWRQSGVWQMSQRHLEDRRRAIVDQDRIIAHGTSCVGLDLEGPSYCLPGGLDEIS